MKPNPSGRYALTVTVLACAFSAVAAGSTAYGVGFRYAQALGLADLKALQATHSEQSEAVARDSRLQLLQTVVRAQQAEALLFDTTTQHTEEKRQREERIPHVTTRYLPAPDAAAQPIPHCVFTAGWLRDYNTALGVPAPATGATAPSTATTAWAAPGTDAELLASGITPADILAHAEDYGLWARHTLAQLNALLDLQQD